jgi:soluble lytic murein transglycosylase-like protein
VAIPSHPLPNGGLIDPAVMRGIRQASSTTQVDFGLLVAEAQQESGFNPDAKAPNSSATGLFQFIDSTWLTMVQRFGSKYGVGDLAQQITTDAAGQPHVADPKLRQQILNLRKDPNLSSDLAAEYIKLNQSEVERALGHKPSSTDLYMAHFLGSAGASQFLKAVEANGNTAAANLFPEAAAANPAIFYDKASGSPRTVSDIYRSFAKRIESGVATIATPGDGAIGDSVSALSSRTASALPVFQRLVLGTTALTDPVRAMMDALASTALNLLRGDEGRISVPPTRTVQHRDPDAV